jgi:hypothetical protein
MNSFLPKDYKIPKAPSGYMKFEDGINSIRVLSDAIVGYEYFTNKNKPVRSREPFEEMPSDIKKDGKVKPFWAFVVWNYNLKMVQILEVPQTSIMDGIKSLVDNPKWSDPKTYDIAITKSAEGMDTKYVVQGEPPIGEPTVEIRAMQRSKPIRLEALYDGSDPLDARQAPDAEQRAQEHAKPKGDPDITFDPSDPGPQEPLG